MHPRTAVPSTSTLKKQALLLSLPLPRGLQAIGIPRSFRETQGPLLRTQVSSVSSRIWRSPASHTRLLSSAVSFILCGRGYVGTGRLSWKKRLSVQTCSTATSSSTATLAADQKLTRSRLSS